eukprot:31230-Pelagococcus_subviridis.AAC.1
MQELVAELDDAAILHRLRGGFVVRLRLRDLPERGLRRAEPRVRVAQRPVVLLHLDLHELRGVAVELLREVHRVLEVPLRERKRVRALAMQRRASLHHPLGRLAALPRDAVPFAVAQAFEEALAVDLVRRQRRDRVREALHGATASVRSPEIAPRYVPTPFKPRISVN